MKRLVEFPLEGGSTILIEVDQPEVAGMEQASAVGIVERSRHTFDQAIARIRPVAEAIIGQLVSLSERPDEVQVVFGLKMSAEAGVFVAAATAEANYEITLTWKHSNKAQVG